MLPHILLCGERGAGKSTLIRRLLEENTRPVSGFLTKRLPPDETGFHPIYIHPAGMAAPDCSARNRIGDCNTVVHNVSPEVFNTLGVAYLRARPGSILVMDELGFMEAGAEAFVRAVFRALDGDIPVLAAVKARFDVPFLNQVRAHPNADVFTVTEENRESLFTLLRPRILGWNAETGEQPR
ncbi:MAG: nucleoside-triphosphatase [Oscillospiraceae bacterium]|nr:nucleoside-triphosphatase [Oscillospiraceae bacterium]